LIVCPIAWKECRGKKDDTSSSLLVDEDNSLKKQLEDIEEFKSSNTLNLKT